MKSMTGFGRSSNRQTSLTSSSRAQRQKKSPKAEPKVDLEVAVKTVNGRFLDFRFHLPREYFGLENDLKAALSSFFKRGTIDISINRQQANSGRSIQLNRDLAKAWKSSLDILAKELRLKINDHDRFAMISRIPEIFKLEGESQIDDGELKLLFKLVTEAALACDQERAREGNALVEELQKLVLGLETLVDEAADIQKEAALELEKKLRARLEEKLADFLPLTLTSTQSQHQPAQKPALDESRIAQEVVMYLDRADINEELVRLREHLRSYQELLKSSDSQGKKLDFYAQELLREVNTIGSKSHIAKLTAIVVEGKTIVERIREQVQNVE